MNSQEKQKRFDFVEDLKMLSSQYGWTLDEAIDIIGFKPKTTDDLLLEKARELYPQGTKFIPIGKNRTRMSDGNIEMLCGRIFCWYEKKMFLVFDTGTWAEVIN